MNNSIQENELMKKCNKCENTSSKSSFYKQNCTCDGYKYLCKVCCKSFLKKYYNNNREWLINHQKIYSSENIEQIKKHYPEGKEK